MTPDPTAIRGHRSYHRRMRVAIVTPYSWTYPGGVNGHVDALARELIASGHELRVLAPVDPPGRLTRALHRAEPEPAELPAFVTGVARTKAFGANGSVSNIGVFPDGVTGMRRALARVRSRRRPRPRAPRGAAELGRVLIPRRPGGRDLPRLLDQAAAQPRRLARRRPAQVQPARRQDRRLPGGRLDRAALVRRGLHRDPERGPRRRPVVGAEAARRRAAADLRRPARRAQGPAGAADRVRGADRARGRAADRDRPRPGRRRALRLRPGLAVADRRARPGPRGRALAAPARRRSALRSVALRGELRHGADRGVRRRYPGARLEHRRLRGRGHRRQGRDPGPARRPPAPGRGAAGAEPGAGAAGADGRGRPPQRPPLRLARGRGRGRGRYTSGRSRSRSRRRARRAPRAGSGSRPPTGPSGSPRGGCPRSTRLRCALAAAIRPRGGSASGSPRSSASGSPSSPPSGSGSTAS